MKTFADIFCAEHRCDLGTFAWRLFWHSLHRRALVVAPLVLVAFPRHFSPDWALIQAVARSYTLRQVDEEIRDFVLDPVNRNAWRRVGKVRVSAQRIRRLARHAFVSHREQSVAPRSALIP